MSGLLSAATLPVLTLKAFIDPSGIAVDRANDIDKPIPKRRMSLESVQDSRIYAFVIRPCGDEVSLIQF